HSHKLNLFQFKSFVQTAATRTARKQGGRSVFELEGANHAAQPVTQCPPFAPAPIPLSHYPEKKNRRKEKQQINGDERGQADANHGAGWVAEGEGWTAGVAAMSLPHSTVAIPQINEPAGAVGLGLNRVRVRCCRACASNCRSPDEFRGNAYW